MRTYRHQTNSNDQLTACACNKYPKKGHIDKALWCRFVLCECVCGNSSRTFILCTLVVYLRVISERFLLGDCQPSKNDRPKNWLPNTLLPRIVRRSVAAYSSRESWRQCAMWLIDGRDKLACASPPGMLCCVIVSLCAILCWVFFGSSYSCCCRCCWECSGFSVTFVLLERLNGSQYVIQLYGNELMIGNDSLCECSWFSGQQMHTISVTRVDGIWFGELIVSARNWY